MSLSTPLSYAGDPTAFGWIVFALYFAAASACFRCAWLRPIETRSSFVRANDRTTWMLTALACVLLGFNKQLDLQTSFMELARSSVHFAGLDEAKRVLQYTFLVALCSGLLVAGFFATRLVRFASVAARTATGGLGIVMFYVLLRASRFQRVGLDSLFGEGLDAFVEVLGLLVIIGAGLSEFFGKKSKTV